MFYYIDNSKKSEKIVNDEVGKNSIILDGEYFGNNEITNLSATSIVSVGKKSFANCSNLKEVYFGADIRKIDELAFAGCESLTDVWFPMLDRNAKVVISHNAFKSCGKICFHIFGLGGPKCGNVMIEEYAKSHHFELMGMI